MRIASVLMIGLLVILVAAGIVSLVMQHYYSDLYRKYSAIVSSRVITGFSPISRSLNGLVFTRPVLIYKICCNGKCRPINEMMTMVPVLNGTCIIYTQYGAYLDLNNSIVIRIGPIPLPTGSHVTMNITRVMRKVLNNGSSSLALPLVPTIIEPIPPWSFKVVTTGIAYTCMNYRIVRELNSHGEPVCVLVPRKSTIRVCSTHLVGAYVNSRIMTTTTGCVSVRVQDPTSIIVLMYAKVLTIRIEGSRRISISFRCEWNNPALGNITFTGTVETNSTIHLPPGSVCQFNHSIIPTGDILLIAKSKVKIEGPGTIYVNPS